MKGQRTKRQSQKVNCGPPPSPPPPSLSLSLSLCMRVCVFCKWLLATPVPSVCVRAHAGRGGYHEAMLFVYQSALSKHSPCTSVYNSLPGNLCALSTSRYWAIICCVSVYQTSLSKHFPLFSWLSTCIEQLIPLCLLSTSLHWAYFSPCTFRLPVCTTQIPPCASVYQFSLSKRFFLLSTNFPLSNYFRYALCLPVCTEQYSLSLCACVCVYQFSIEHLFHLCPESSNLHWANTSLSLFPPSLPPCMCVSVSVDGAGWGNTMDNRRRWGCSEMWGGGAVKAVNGNTASSQITLTTAHAEPCSLSSPPPPKTIHD